jgi:AtzH-like/1-carboxybiuret hydrolase subunit AtzG-like
MSTVNDPDVIAELHVLHEEYEAALVGNDVDKLTRFFWDSPLALRFGVRENLYGAQEIEAFRKARSAIGLNREISNVNIVTFGHDCGIVTLEFRRTQPPGGAQGRQSQVWRKFSEGWRIVSAHVSLMYDGYVDQAANLIGLNIPSQYREAVIQNIERTSRIAASLFDTPLTDATPAAPRFEP